MPAPRRTPDTDTDTAVAPTTTTTPPVPAGASPGPPMPTRSSLANFPRRAKADPLSANPRVAAGQALAAVLGYEEAAEAANQACADLAAATPDAVAEALGRAVVVLEALWTRTIKDAMSAPLAIRANLLKTAIAIRVEIRQTLDVIDMAQRRMTPLVEGS